MYSQPSISYQLVLGSLAVCMTVLYAGCSDTGPALGRVSGKVTLDGIPLAMATVEFTPEEQGRPSVDVTDENGEYELGYALEKKGALIGKHRVRITTIQNHDDEAGNQVIVREKLPRHYHVQTELEAMVESGKQTIDWELKSR